MASSGSPTGLHALLVTAPYQGHFAPAVDLAIKLAARGFVVTFACTEAFQHQRTASGASSADHNDVFAGARSRGLDIRYELVSDGLPVSFDRHSHPDQFYSALLHLLPNHVDELIRKLRLSEAPSTSSSPTPSSRRRPPWPRSMACRASPSGPSRRTIAMAFVCLVLDRYAVRGVGLDNRRDTITYIPGIPAIEPIHLVSYLRETDNTTPLQQMIARSFEEVKRCDFVLANTVQELEEETIAVLHHEKPFYAVGPVFPDGFTGGTVMTSLWPQSDCSSWLDSMPPSSVLYVSFGSIASISNKDLEEIAYGVLSSKANFIWVLRPGTSSSGAAVPLPQGFLEASRGRGMVVPWCRQREVLQHPAVGGFLTHCGWNSVAESMWCGVPMLCFPLFSDQPPNRKLVVQNLGIGTDLGEIGEVSRGKVSSRIDDLMGGEGGAELRRKMEEVKKAVQGAVAPHGSSCKNLDQFTADLLRLLSQKKASADTETKRG
ncbi:hypothetical protein GW17_00010161 [Ensete ventricosum]|nr:hypothetical protein GW17_00010161 [Ensete ventricosum]